MNDFETWFEKRYGPYPGIPGELMSDIHRRFFKAVAEYLTESVNKKSPDT